MSSGPRLLSGFFPVGPTRPGPLSWALPVFGLFLLGIPLVYLVVRAAQADPAQLAELLFRERNLELLANTILLVVLVVGAALVMALPLAWFTERSGLRHRKAWTLLFVLPLAIPGYVLAYTLMGIGGHYGVAANLFGATVSRPSGLGGSVLALALYTFPYLYLNLRTALAKMDPALEESARSMGLSSGRVFLKIVVPQLLPAVGTGALVIALYVLGDFGVVSLMRYPTLSSAVYIQYAAAYDRVYAAILALALALLASVLIALEARLLRGHGHGARTRRAPVQYGGRPQRVALTMWAGLVVTASLVLPVLLLGFWMMYLEPATLGPTLEGLAASFLRSVGAALPAAVLAVVLALPTVYLSRRHPSGLSRSLERSAALGYGIAPIAIGLGFVFFSIGGPFYQTLLVLVAAYALHFLALASGPIRSSLSQESRRVEETARSLGYSARQAFARAVLPTLRKAMTASGILVFIMAMKELPIALLLAPTGYTTLAMSFFSRASEAQYAEAAPYAAAIVIVSAFVAALILRYEGGSHASA